MVLCNKISKTHIKSKINRKLYLKGGENCNLVTEQIECINRKPECLWNFKKKKCLDSAHIPVEPVFVYVDTATRPSDVSVIPEIKKETKISEKFKTTFFISPQLERLSIQLGINGNMRETIDPEISNEELDILLNNIKIESDKKDTLIVIANHIIRENNIIEPNELLNIKIKVLLDNLAKKLCRCTQKIGEEQKEGASAKKVSSEAVCRSSIFHRRGIDYITHDCGNADLNVERYSYKMGPLLRPALNSRSNILLRRHIPNPK